MYCGKCGTENANDAKFCRGCGQALVNESVKKEAENSAVETQVGAKKVNPEVIGQLLEKVKKLPKKAVLGIVGVVVILVIVICLALNMSTTINLDKYVTIEATGYDGYGNVSAKIDWDAIEEKYGDKISFTSKAKTEYGGFLGYMTPIDVLKDSIKVEFSEKDYLENGDKVEYTWNIDAEITEYIECKIKSNGGTYEVSTLEEVGTFDAFADLEVTFEGIAPSGRVTYNYSGDKLGYYDFSCSQSNGLSNGDTVTISITNTDMEYYAERYGMVPSKLENEYKVSGLQEYVSLYGNLSDDFISTLKSEAEDTIYAYVANDYNSSSALSDLQYVGYIFNFIKDVDSYFNYYNSVYVIYSGTVSNSAGKFDTMTVYFPVRFTNILCADGSFSYESNKNIAGSSYLGNSYYTTKGYTNPLTCYIDIVESNSEMYDAEVGDGFEQYAEYELIASLNDISADYKAILQADAIERIEEYIASSYNGGSVATDLQYVGEYLLLSKTQGVDFANNVKYIVVCSATVSNTKGRFDTTTVYFPVEYDGVVKLPGDEYMCTSVKGILGSSTLPNSWYNTKGYVDGTYMYSKIVTANREYYKYEVSEELQQFGN